MRKWMFAAVLLTACIGKLSAQSPWTRAMYAEQDYKSFARLPMAGQVIDPVSVDYALLNAAVFYAACEQRVKNGLRAFLHSPALEKAAFGHSRDMVNLRFFSHTSKVDGKREFWDRTAAEGVPNSAGAENIAYNFLQNGRKNHTYLSFAKALLEQWMKSSGHRRNILNKSYTYMGCGAFIMLKSPERNFTRVYATQNFSDTDAPASQEVEIDYR